MTGGREAVQGIVAVAELGVPIYITETGIADAKGDRRAVFLDTYVPQARPGTVLPESYRSVYSLTVCDMCVPRLPAGCVWHVQ